MALWIHNVSPPGTPDGEEHSYELKINHYVLAEFKHVRAEGAAACLRAAADAMDGRVADIAAYQQQKGIKHAVRKTAS
mgnify:CR=1 FL=1